MSQPVAIACRCAGLKHAHQRADCVYNVTLIPMPFYLSRDVSLTNPFKRQASRALAPVVD
jgi:hypothetical protein